MSNKTAGIANIILGAWLFISAFLWPHSASQFTNTWILGVLAIILAALSIRLPDLRWALAALAVWLFISALALPSITAGTVWHNIIVAVLILAIALSPLYLNRGRRARGPSQPGAPPPPGP